MPGPLPKYPIQLTPEQEAHLQHLSTCYTAPFAEVQRARILLFAHQHPTWRNAEIARRVGCCVRPSRTGVSAGSRPRVCAMRRGPAPAAPSRRPSGRR